LIETRAVIGDKCTTSIDRWTPPPAPPHQGNAHAVCTSTKQLVETMWWKIAMPKSARCYEHEASCLLELRSTPSMLRKHNKLVGLKKRNVSQLDRLLFLMDVSMKLLW